MPDVTRRDSVPFPRPSGPALIDGILLGLAGSESALAREWARRLLVEGETAISPEGEPYGSPSGLTATSDSTHT